jgi:hypothetical protein
MASPVSRWPPSSIVRSTDVLRRAGPAITLAVVTACTTTSFPAATPRPASPTIDAQGADSTATPAASASPTIAPRPLGIELPALGHPLDPMTLLGAMRDSRRPGGVPDELETEAIAGAVADAIWTFEGEPWTAMAVGGSCGPQTCTLEVAGAAPGAQGDDVWVFTVTLATGGVSLLAAELNSVPAEVVAGLDALARALDESGSLDGMILASASWLPPPNAGQFILSYRSGGEEFSCGVDLTLDAPNAQVVSSTPIGC